MFENMRSFELSFLSLLPSETERFYMSVSLLYIRIGGTSHSPIRRMIFFSFFHAFEASKLPLLGKFVHLKPHFAVIECPLAIRPSAAFSSFCSRNGNSYYIGSENRDNSVQSIEFGNENDEYGKSKKMGPENYEDSSLFGCSKDVFQDFHGSNLLEVEVSDNSSDEQEVDINGDDDFPVLNLNYQNGEQKDNIFQFEGIDEEYRHPLVRETCKLLELRSAWNSKLEGELRHLLRGLKPKQVCAVLRSQADERVALKFFYWADRQWRYRHEPIVYHVMVEILSKTKLCKGAKRVLRLMARRGIEIYPENFGQLMVSYSRAGKLRNAMQVLTLMHKVGVQPNLSVCNTAVHVLVTANKLEKALRYVARMQLIGIRPNVVTYNILIKGYCDVHRIDDAMELIVEMPHKGCSPDKISYYTVMGFLCKDKRTKEIMELMVKMKDNGLFPDHVTYNNLIHMLCKNGLGNDALASLREAEEKGFRFDKVGYSAIVHSFCKEGNIVMAMKIVNEMFSKDCAPDVVTYTTVLNGLCRIGQVDQAKNMLQHMYKHGCKPNTVSYTALLTGLCKSGNSLQAKEMLNKSEEEWWTPNAITYSSVMHGLRREGKFVEACDMLKEMVKKGFFPGPVEINLLIQSICQEGKTDEAKKLMEWCLNNGCAVNVVHFTTVIHGYCQKNDMEAALSLLDDMYLSNKRPDVFTYTTVINALARNGKIEEATKLTMQMLQKGLDPTPITYRAVIHWYCQKDRVEDLFKLLEKMLSRQKCRTVYNQIIEKLCSFGNLQKADELLSLVLRTASRIDANTCHILMDSYLSKGCPIPAYRVVRRMFRRNLIPDLKLCEKVNKKLILEGNLKEADDIMLRFVERGLIQPCRKKILQN